jgi:UDP-GlcNAc:undecaprenyl-phosphate GlcNAc-1-phosphate transferase
MNILDYPSGIKTHKVPTPYLGGASVYISFMVISIISITFFSTFTEDIQSILLGASFIFILGLVDDLYKLSIEIKFLWQSIAAIILILLGIKIQFLPEFLNIILTILFVVGITNAMNIIDIMDGLCGGVSLIASLCFGIILFQNKSIQESLIAFSLAGAILGFLPYNFPNAKIFLGDAGSLFIGFVLSGLAIIGKYTLVNTVGIFSPILILGIPIFETIFVMLMRAKKGIPVFRGSFDHFPLRLLRKGIKKINIVISIYFISIVLCLLAYFACKIKDIYALFIYFIALILFIISGIKLSKME